MSELHAFARWLRKEMDTRDMTSGSLAQRLGVSPDTVHNWRRGVTEPPSTVLAPLAAALGVAQDRFAALLMSAWPDERATGEPFSAWLRRRIDARGLSIRAFGRQLGASESEVYRWLNDQGRPHEDRRPQIATLLGVSPGELEAAVRGDAKQ